MKKTLIAPALVASAFAHHHVEPHDTNAILVQTGSTIAATPSTEAISLFNGKDLTGWIADVPKADKDKEVKPSFIVREGKLVSMGEPRGHLVTEQSFSNYRLEVEYRFPEKPGNCGIMVHTSKLRAMGIFPQSIEVQLQHKNAGDFWVIKEDITVPDMKTRRPMKDGKYHRRLINLTDDSEKPVGEWNTIAIECKDDEITVWVNGDLVNHGFNATTTKGQIALQAEGSEVEFRKLELTPLPQPEKN